MADCVAEQHVWHLVYGPIPDEADNVPVRCGGVVTLPWGRDDREPDCPDCIAGRQTMERVYQPGQRVYRYVYVGSDRSFDINEPQPLTVVRMNRKTVTVRTDAGSQFRLDPAEIVGHVTWEDDQ